MRRKFLNVKPRAQTAAVLGLLVLCCAVGCGPKGPKRYEHWGSVTFRGKPIPAGQVIFDPQLPGPDGPQGMAVIKDGQFDTRQMEDRGPGAGKYILRIYAADGIEAPEAPVGKMMFTSEILIPIELPEADSEVNIVIPPNTR